MDDKGTASALASGLQARLPADVDREVLDFFTTYVDSFVKWDLLQFFHKNPSTLDTAENIARYIGRADADVEPALQELAAARLLTVSSIGEMHVYTLDADVRLRRALAKFALAADDRDFRRKAVYHLVRQ